tara:strand:- start:761 stop:1105 length:345 start_codon:yes stop_codon:yes gene_type:complete
MKNKFLILLLILITSTSVIAQELYIEARNISLDKKNQISVFENDVIITTQEGNIIKGDFAKYDLEKKFITMKGNVSAIDNKKNIIETNNATYDEKKKFLKVLMKLLLQLPKVIN